MRSRQYSDSNSNREDMIDLDPLEQEDVKTADLLAKALDMAMTRNARGGEFVERRDYPAYVEQTLHRLNDLRKQYGY